MSLHERIDDAGVDWDPASNLTVPDPASLPTPTLTALVNTRLVASLNHTSVETTSWTVELPGFFNVTEKTRTASTLTYTQHTSLHTVTTEVVTNTSVVGFDWIVIGENVTEDSEPAANWTKTNFFGLPEDFGNRYPVWPAGDWVEPSHELQQETFVRPVAHILSFLKPPPRGPILLKSEFEVSLRVTTEAGLALPGEQVQAVLLADYGSGARLAPGSYGYTDEAGVATFNMSISEGTSGDYLLLFGSGGTLQVTPRRDVGSSLNALESALGKWRTFIEPVIGLAGEAATALREGALFEVLKSKVEQAVRAEMERVVEQAESCLALLNYTADQATREQRIQASFELVGTPSEGLASFFEDIALDDIVWQNFEEETIEAERPEALPCFQQAFAAAGQIPQVQQDPIQSANIYAAALSRRLLQEMGLDSLAGVIETFEPHLGDIDSHMIALNQSMRLATETFNHITNQNNGGPSWQAGLRVATLLLFGWGAPPARLISVESGVGSVELTAPLAGYSLFTSASSEPSRNLAAHGSSSYACVLEGYMSYMPPLRSARPRRRAAHVVGRVELLYDSIRAITAMPLASPLWQPPLFFTQNWMLDASAYPREEDIDSWQFGSSMPQFGRYSQLCRTSFITNEQVLPNTVLPDSVGLTPVDEGVGIAVGGSQYQGYDRDVAPVVVDPLFPRFEYAAAFVEAAGADAASVRLYCAGYSCRA